MGAGVVGRATAGLVNAAFLKELALLISKQNLIVSAVERLKPHLLSFLLSPCNLVHPVPCPMHDQNQPWTSP